MKTDPSCKAIIEAVEQRVAGDWGKIDVRCRLGLSAVAA